MRLRIAEIRTSLSLTQQDLAERAGISRPYLAQLESGDRNLNTKRQKQIADALNVHPTELVDFSAPEKNEEELMVKAFRSLPSEQRKAWIEWARATLTPSKEGDE